MKNENEMIMIMFMDLRKQGLLEKKLLLLRKEINNLVRNKKYTF